MYKALLFQVRQSPFPVVISACRQTAALTQPKQPLDCAMRKPVMGAMYLAHVTSAPLLKKLTHCIRLPQTEHESGLGLDGGSIAGTKFLMT